MDSLQLQFWSVMFSAISQNMQLYDSSVILNTHKTLRKINFSIFKSRIGYRTDSLKKFYRKASPGFMKAKGKDFSLRKLQTRATLSFSDSIVKWAINNNISYTAVSKLLKILRDNGIQNLPVNYRDLLLSKQNEINVTNMAPGEYMHFGLQENLRELMWTLISKSMFSGIEIPVSIFIDQLVFSKLTHQSLWMILGSVEGYPNNIFLIGAYRGYSNPKFANSFLSEFVKEAKELTEKGLDINNGIFYSFKIKRLICDALAKSFVLNIKSHLSYSSCTKCNTLGEYKNKSMSFLEKGTPKKDEDFEKAGIYRYGKTCLLEIPNFGVVSNITIDYMHLVCLGVVNKLVSIWIKNKKYWNTNASLSDIIRNLDCVQPLELYKKHKNFKIVSRWLVQDYRLFLLYFGLVALKNTLKEDYYNHFLLLHAACRLLCTEATKENIDNGREMLNDFVKNYQSLYGTEPVTHNFHGLYHLADECISHGTLDNFSSFPFEKFLIKIKSSLEKNKKKLIFHLTLKETYEEIFRKNLAKLSPNNVKVTNKINKANTNNQFKNFSVYSKLSLGEFSIIPNSVGDNHVFLKNGKIVEVTHILKNCENEYFIGGKEYTSVYNFHSKPYDSLKLSTFIVENVSDRISLWPVNYIEKKGVKLHFGNNKSVLIPLLNENF